MNFFEKLKERDLFYQVTNNITNVHGLYCGFDTTAPSLQIGNLTSLAVFRLAHLYNIPIFALLGEATTAIGDPTDKNQTRPKLSSESIQKNISLIHDQIQKLCPYVKFVNNNDWIKKLNTVDFLNIAAFLPVSYIIKLKTFAKRLENNDPFNMQELLYPLIQGYDFLHLFEQFQCNVQIGGQDQWCNIITGAQLIQAKHHKDVCGLTFPLLVNSNGEKMGKSIKGAIYLSSDIYDFWQYWRNIEDSMTLTCIKRFTLLDLNTLPSDINMQKILLANEITSWVFSKEEALIIAEKSKAIFENNNYDNAQLLKIDATNILDIITQIDNSITKNEAKRLIEQKAIKIDNKIIENWNEIIQSEKFVIFIGKKRIYNIQKNI